MYFCRYLKKLITRLICEYTRWEDKKGRPAELPKRISQLSIRLTEISADKRRGEARTSVRGRLDEDDYNMVGGQTGRR